MSASPTTSGTNAPLTNVDDAKVINNVDDTSTPVGFYDRARRFFRRDPSWKRGPGADDAFQHAPRGEFPAEDEDDDGAEEEEAEEVPQRLRRRMPMTIMSGSGNYHAGENRSMLASTLPLVEHGRGSKSSGRHCEPTTMPVGVAWGDGLVALSNMLPLTDPHVVRARKERAVPSNPSDQGRDTLSKAKEDDEKDADRMPSDSAASKREQQQQQQQLDEERESGALTPMNVQKDVGMHRDAAKAAQFTVRPAAVVSMDVHETHDAHDDNDDMAKRPQLKKSTKGESTDAEQRVAADDVDVDREDGDDAEVPHRLRQRMPMAVMAGSGNYQAGENRSTLAARLPIVEQGRGAEAGGREPTTMPVGVAWGDGLAGLSNLLPLTDHRVVRAPEEQDEAVLTPMNHVRLDDARESRVSGEKESTFSPMGAYSA